MVSKLKGRKLTEKQMRSRLVARADNWLEKNHKLTKKIKALPPAMRYFKYMMEHK